MFVVSKIFRHLAVQCRYRQSSHSLSNMLQPKRFFYSRNMLFVKMYQEHENKHAYDIMKNKGYAIDIDTRTIDSEELTEEQFETWVIKDWSKEQYSDIFKAFSIMGNYCANRKLSISDKMFDNFIDILTDNIKHASDEELESLFHALESWPATESIRTRNFIEVWAALDDECLNRITHWTFDKMLSFVTLFYKLNITKHSEYSFKCVQKLTSKAKQLSPGQLVQTVFFIGLMRKQTIDIHNLELQFDHFFEELSLDEIAIISMGLFKSKTPIRSNELCSKIADRIIENSSQIHEVSLAALLKILRYSMKTNYEKILQILGTLEKEVPRLSVMSIVHIALLGTSTLTLHKGCLIQIADTISSTLSSCRLKDIERLALTYGTFSFIPRPKGENNLCEKLIEELRKPEREAEINKHSRSFACCVNYLSLLGYYPIDLMNKVLDKDFLTLTYGKNCHGYGREILTIHNTSLLFCADKEMNRLSDKEAVVLAKKYTDYIPDENYKKQYNITERMFIDVMATMRKICGGHDYVTGDHIVTHHQRGDIIICYDDRGSPLPVVNAFPTKSFGIMRRPPDKNKWIVLIIAGKNGLIYGTDTPSGPFQVKVKELKTLGYHPALVIWSTYNNLKTIEEKSKYLTSLIKEAINQ